MDDVEKIEQILLSFSDNKYRIMDSQDNICYYLKGVKAFTFNKKTHEVICKERIYWSKRYNCLVSTTETNKLNSIEEIEQKIMSYKKDLKEAESYKRELEMEKDFK